MKKIFFLLTISFTGLASHAQERLFTKNAVISFFSAAPLEKIEATNKNALSVLDKITGQVEFSALMKGFGFDKALMQEHFNENYVESDKFPKAVFKGKINDLTKINFSVNGTYSIKVTGTLTMHGQTNSITAPVTFTVAGGAINAFAVFDVLLSDYKIAIPALVKDNIAQNVTIEIKSNYQLMK